MGAEAVHSVPIPSPEDVAAGYALHWGQPQMPFESLWPAEATLASDELESFELGVLALEELYTVTLAVSSVPALPAGAVRVRTTQRVSNDGGANMPWQDFALHDGNSMSIPDGAHKSFWVTFDGNLIPPGSYAVTMDVTPLLGPPRQALLDLVVLDTQRLEPDEVNLYMYHNDGCLQQHNLPVFTAHLELMRESGQRQIVLDAHPRHNNSVDFWFNTSGEIQANYSGIDRLLNPARALGFDIFGWPTSSLVWDAWLSAEMLALPPAELAELRDELTRLFFQHILDLGFEEIWWYSIDEPSIEQATDPAFVAMLESYTNRFPMLRPHIALSRYNPAMYNLLDPSMEIWQTDQGILAQIRKDEEAGLIAVENTDWLGFYGSAYYFHTPDGLRGGGWFAASLQATFYAWFAYCQAFTPTTPYVCFATADGSLASMPLGTPALEGVREGFEDLGYWHTLDVLIERADTSGAALTPQQCKELEAARFFRESLVAQTSEASLVPWILHPGNDGRGFGPYPAMVSDRWLFRDLKGDMLGHIQALEQFPTVPVPPPITIEKEPSYQEVLFRSDAMFTITVQNTGTQQLSNVTVTDALAPDCTGVFGDLAPGASTSYACTVANVTEVLCGAVTVTADPLAGPQVSAGDCAVVDFIDAPFSNLVAEAVVLTCSNSSPDAEYHLEATGDLAGGDWTSTGVRVAGDGSTRTLLDPAGGAALNRSYRLSVVPAGSGSTIFQGTLENQGIDVPPSGNAEVGAWVAGASAHVILGGTKELQVFGPAGRNHAYGRATQPAPIGTPLHFGFEVQAATHDNFNASYTPMWVLYGPTTGGIILAIRLNYIGHNGSPPAFESPIEAWNGSAWVDTGLVDPLSGSGVGRLYEIDYTVGDPGFTLTVEGVGSAVVNAVGSTVRDVVGIGFTRGTSSSTYCEADNFLLADASVQPPSPSSIDIAMGPMEQIAFQSETGVDYLLESSSNDVDWVSTGLRIRGDGTTMIVTDPAGALSAPSYRIMPE